MTISAVLTPCSARKQQLPNATLQAARVPRGTQDAVAACWLERLGNARAQLPARELYQGHAFRLVQRVAVKQGCPLFVMSAGLGLVADTASVPAYDLTLSPMAASMIQRRVRGTFDAPAWWKRMQAGPYANDLAMLSGGNGRILVALTQPYAALCGAALAQLPKEDIHRLRLFGGGLKAHLPATLHANILPYDARLDALVPGTRLNFAARALAHFATLLQDAPQDAIETDCARVERALASEIRPTSCVRTRATDDELLCRIGGFIRRGLSAPAALRELRSCAGVACEERRFRRLFQQARA